VKDKLATAIAEWQAALTPERVLVGEEATGAYAISAIGVSRTIPAVVRPTSADEVATVVRLARRHKVPVYPVSSGHNWGYGSAVPPTEGCVVVDLSGMNRILEVDPELGLATLEPGVTQAQLRAYLDDHRLPLMVPTHGGGPTCSLLGNALERGYGITPYTDHFAAVTALEAVLPDGTLYRSPHAELGATTVDRAFKWGVGPYLDGLFAQGNFGIVTRMTLALAPQPERVEAFLFSLAHDAGLEDAVLRTRQLLRTLGASVGAVNLMNARRVLSMTAPYPRERVADGATMPEALVAELAREHGIEAWTGAGALYGSARMVKAARAELRRVLGPATKQLVFMTAAKQRRVQRLVQLVPGDASRRLQRRLDTVEKTLQVMAGTPSEVALPLAYWMAGQKPADGRPLDPARDGCGLVWYSPLVPTRPGEAREYVEMVERICCDHGIEPLITLTTLSARCYDSTVPLLFDRSRPDAVRRAHACYRALFEAGRARGFVPYRANIAAMDLFVDADGSFWHLARNLKRAIDPDGILAPGRYSLDR